MKLLIAPTGVRVTMIISEARSVRKMLAEFAELTDDLDKRKRAFKYAKELDEILGG